MYSPVFLIPLTFQNYLIKRMKKTFSTGTGDLTGGICSVEEINSIIYVFFMLKNITKMINLHSFLGFSIASSELTYTWPMCRLHSCS